MEVENVKRNLSIHILMVAEMKLKQLKMENVYISHCSKQKEDV